MHSFEVKRSLFDLESNTGQIEGVPANPRTIKNAAFKRLKTSVLMFPEMLQVRPTVVVGNVVIGGNRRLSVLQEIAKLNPEKLLNLLHSLPEYRCKPHEIQDAILSAWEGFIQDERKTIPTQELKDATSDQIKEFIIKDNISFGEPEYEMLLSEWNTEDLKSWGMDLPKNWEISQEDQHTDDKAENVKKSIQIKFNQEDYVDAYRVIQWFRDNNIYLGKDVLNFLTELKNKYGEDINS